MSVSKTALARISTLDELMDFLSNELKWPIDIEDRDRATYNFSPEELNVSKEVAEKLNSIRQLKPSSQGQPWGIFLIDLVGEKLSKKAINNLLDRLTAGSRKRGATGAWKKSNLLFIVSTGTRASFQIHFLTFKDSSVFANGLVGIDWRPAHLTPQYASTLSEKLLPSLKWPSKGESDEDWQHRWASVFRSPPGSAMRDAATLTRRMAEVASHLRESIKKGLETEGPEGPLHKLLAAVKLEIVSDATPESFADMCAQTITYGLLAARIHDPKLFASSPALSSLPLEDEFLEELFEDVMQAISMLPLDQLSVHALYADLVASDVEAVLDQFGNTAYGGDPVIDFYEKFLALYDKDERKKAGAFYTPKPVVEAMVSMTEELLMEKFGLNDGFADQATWDEVCANLNIQVPAGIKGDRQFISVLDPATGTGTYPVSIIQNALKRLESSGMSATIASERINLSLIPNLKAFELMLTPYTIANLKLSLLGASSLDGKNKNVFLTNTLTLQDTERDITDPESAISREGEKALSLKIEEPFTVIIGNPPYGREESSALDEKVKGVDDGGIITKGNSYYFSGVPLDDFLNGIADKKKKAHLKNLYVYFWRWAIWQAFQKPINSTQSPRSSLPLTTSPGIVSFITGSSFVTKPSFAAFRSYLRTIFDEIHIIDLGGDSRESQSDENVFDILSPVAVMIGVRTSGQAANDVNDCKVYYQKLEGSRKYKLGELPSISLKAGVRVYGDAQSIFAPSEKSILSSSPDLGEVFSIFSTGCKTGRTWVSATSEDVLKVRWQTLLSMNSKDRHLAFRSSRNKNSQSRTKAGKVHLKPIAELASNHECPKILSYSYRPFDSQWVLADQRLIDQQSIFMDMLSEKQIIMASGWNLTKGPSAIVTRDLPEMHSFNGRGGKDFYPLYVDSTSQEFNLTPMAKQYAREMSAREPELTFFAYVYGVLGTQAYTDVFGPELEKSAFKRARLPLTRDKEVYKKVAEIGTALIKQHANSFDLRSGVQLKTFEAQPVKVVQAPSKITFPKPGGVVAFDNGAYCDIPEEILTFNANGVKVVKSWLLNRKAEPKGKRSSPLDAVNETKWVYNDEFVKMIADVSAVIEAKKLVMPLLQKVAQELEAQPGK